MPKIMFRPAPTPPPFVPPVPVAGALTFTARQANSSVAFNINGSLSGVSLSYSIDNGENWNPYTFGQSINLAAVGDSVMFKGDNDSFSEDDSNFIQAEMTGKIAASGSIMSLLDSQGIIKPLTPFCFYNLFAYCTSLTEAPELPSTTLAESCYKNMFEECESLVQAPMLPATTLAASCYYYMFLGCTSLVQAPTLPSKKMEFECYYAMFNNCTSLTQAPALQATTLAESCYAEMFKGCTSLSQAPMLPATTLAKSCYNSMFNGCTSLIQAPALPALTLAEYCYAEMFDECSLLVQAPELPASTLVEHCYYFMFTGCLSLTFVKCNATNISANDCTANWLSSVSSNGTFKKNATMNDWPSGESGIPDGWTVENI